MVMWNTIKSGGNQNILYFATLQGKNILAVDKNVAESRFRADISHNSVYEMIFILNTIVFDILLFNIHLIIPFINFS